MSSGAGLLGDRSKPCTALPADRPARYCFACPIPSELERVLATHEEAPLITITSKQRTFASWTADVLIYTVVLNLFVEYRPSVIVESFTISILTAVLFKVLLDLVMGLEGRVHAFFATKEGAIYRVMGPASLFAVLFFGKLLVLQAVHAVFGDAVELGSLAQEVVLILALMITREVFHRIYVRLGEPEAATDGEPAPPSR